MALPVKKVAAAAAAATAITASVIPFFEGTRTQAYRDPVGIPTICTGHTEGVVMGQVRSLAECDALLREDVETAMASVLALTRVPVNAHELAAYTSFVFNVGHGNFARSTLLKKLNAGDREGACKELHRWVYARGQKLPGLIKRREAEYRLCMTPVQEPA